MIAVPAALIVILGLVLYGATHMHLPEMQRATARVSIERTAVKAGDEIVIHIGQVPKGWSGEVMVNNSQRFPIHSNVYRLRASQQNGFNLFKPTDLSIRLSQQNGDNILIANVGDFRITTIPSKVSVSPEEAYISDQKNSGAIQVTAEKTFEWSVTGVPEWLKITSGAQGKGPGEIAYEVAPNMSNESRSAALTIGDKIFEITQRHPSVIMVPYQENFGSFVPPPPVWAVNAHKGAPSVDSGIRWILDEQLPQRSVEKIEREGPGGSPSLVIDRKQADPHQWTSQVYMPGIDLHEGLKYRVSLFLKAENRAEVLVGLGQSSPPYNTCGLSQTVFVPNAWTEFTSLFQLSGKDCGASNNRLAIMFGKVSGKLWIAKISISESDLSITPENQTLSASGGSGDIRVISPSGTPWTVRDTPDWITVSAVKTGSHSGVVRYTALENVSNEHRAATIHIGDAMFHVDQPRSWYINVPFLENFSPPPVQWTPLPDVVDSTMDPPNRWVLLDLTSRRTNVTVTPEGPQGGNSVVLDKTQADNAAWTTQFYLPGLRILTGVDYRVSLWMKAEHPGVVWLGFGQRREPYHACGLFERMSVDNRWTEYNFKFRAAGEHCGPENNRLDLQVGGMSGKLWLAKVAIDKQSAAQLAAVRR